MNVEELWKELHKLCTGKPGEIDSQIAEYERLAPAEGLAKAQKYLESSQKGQDNCQSDWAYWGWAGDIARAKMLVAVFSALASGRKEFPPLPETGDKVLMDKLWYVEQWAAQVKG